MEIQDLVLLQMSNSVVYTFLGGLVLLFLIVVATYYLLSVEKQKILHSNFLDGLWRRQGHSTEGIPWAFEYFFNGEYVEVYGTPKYHGRARYKAVKEIERLIVLQLTEVTGDLEDRPNILQIGVDRQGKMIYIDQKAFQQVSTSIIRTSESPSPNSIEG